MAKYKSKKVTACSKCGQEYAIIKQHYLPACKCNGQPVKFDSKKEASYYRELLLLKKAGQVKDIELQPSFTLQEGFTKNGKRHRPITYKADFLVTYNDGRREVIDVKGMKTEVFKIKAKLFEKRYDELEIKLI